MDSVEVEMTDIPRHQVSVWFCTKLKVNTDVQKNEVRSSECEFMIVLKINAPIRSR